MKLLDYVRLYDIEDDNFCDSVISYYSQWDWELHAWGDSYSGFHSEDDGGVENLFPPREDNLAYPICEKIFEDFSSYYDLGLTGFTIPKFAKYKKNSHLRRHHDHVKDAFDGERKGIPVCTAVGLLNDEFEGGDFFLCDEKIELKKGYVLVFPSCFAYPHEVKLITSGIRYTFVSMAW